MNKSILTALFSITVSLTFSQVVINEYSCGNKNLTDNFGRTPDWIELFNSGTGAVDISGYHLSDNLTLPLKWAFPSGTTIAAGNYLRVWC